MSRQALFQLSTSTANPRDIGVCPFWDPAEKRLDTSPPLVRTALYNYTICTKRALNLRIVGFCEPTLGECVKNFAVDMRSTSLMGSDPTSLKDVLRRRRGEVDVRSLPWEPRKEYKEWLQRQGRLAE